MSFHPFTCHVQSRHVMSFHVTSRHLFSCLGIVACLVVTSRVMCLSARLGFGLVLSCSALLFLFVSCHVMWVVCCDLCHVLFCRLSCCFSSAGAVQAAAVYAFVGRFSQFSLVSPCNLLKLPPNLHSFTPTPLRTRRRHIAHTAPHFPQRLAIIEDGPLHQALNRSPHDRVQEGGLPSATRTH